MQLKKRTVDRTDIKLGPKYIYNYYDKYMYFDFDGAENYLRYLLDTEYDEDSPGTNYIYRWVFALSGGFYLTRTSIRSNIRKNGN